MIREGECVSSIAKDTGHFWETIWNAPSNTELKEVREDPNVLLPQDRLTIPELRQRDEDCATEQIHRFRRRGEPAKLRIRLMEQDPEPEDSDEDDEEAAADRESGTPREDAPRANVPFTLEIDRQFFTGTSDEDGYIEVPIPGNARQGTLTIDPGTPDEMVLPVQLGGVNPISEISGVKQRLNNLAFGCGDDSEEDSDNFRAALRAFKVKQGLPDDDKLDQKTRDKLREGQCHS